LSQLTASSHRLPAGFEEQICAIVGEAHLRAAEAPDSVAGCSPALIVEPANEAEIAQVLACADATGVVVIPRGGGTKLEWGNPPTRADLILSLTRLDQVVEHAWADLTVTVEAGCTLARLQETLASHGQRLALDPMWPEQATVGGILATNDSGALRLRYGGLRDLVIGITLALPDGTLARSGGKVVKNVAGYDLPKLATGALGTLGVIIQATFRLHPLPQNTRTLSARVADAAAAQSLSLAIQDSKLGHSSLQVRASPGSFELDVLLEGTEAGLQAQESSFRAMAASTGQIVLGSAEPWGARQQLWSADGAAIAKLSVLPTSIAATLERIESLAAGAGLRWGAVFQATGIGYTSFEGSPAAQSRILQQLRDRAQQGGGSLVVVRQPSDDPIEAWGEPGDAVPLMRAVKQQLDPNQTLNPGRFMGGI